MNDPPCRHSSENLFAIPKIYPLQNSSGIWFYSLISSFGKDIPHSAPLHLFFVAYLRYNTLWDSQFILPLWQRHRHCDFYSNIWKQNMSNASRSNEKEMRERERGKNFMLCTWDNFCSVLRRMFENRTFTNAQFKASCFTFK